MSNDIKEFLIVRIAADYLRPGNESGIHPEKVNEELAIFLVDKERSFKSNGTLVNYLEYEQVPFEIVVILVEIWITRNPTLEPYKKD